jgi:c-di-GMP-binding flagellar brake protein YcgR
MSSINEERRTFIRIELPGECIINTNDATLHARCLNLSATGMSIALECGELNIGQTVQIQLSDKSDDVPTLNAQARVVRIIDKNERKYGIHFLTS